MTTPKPLTGNKMALGQMSISAIALLIALMHAVPTAAQSSDLFSDGPQLGGADSDAKPVATTAEATIDPATGKGLLTVRAKVKDGWHIYSVTQKPGGPVRSKIKLDPKAPADIAGEPKPLNKPDSHPEPLFNNLVVEAHAGEVAWEVPIQLKAGVDPATVQIAGSVYAQACEGTDRCIPPANYSFTAKVSLAAAAEGQAAADVPQERGPAPVPIAQQPFRSERSHVSLTGVLRPAKRPSGNVAELTIGAQVDPGWHVYALADEDGSGGIGKPTLIVLTDSGGLRYLKPMADRPPHTEKGPTGETQHYYENIVSWMVDLELPTNTSVSELPIAGIVGYQVCSDTACDLPLAARFSGVMKLASDGSLLEPMELHFEPAKYAEAAALARGKSPLVETTPDVASVPPAYKFIDEPPQSATLPFILFFAFVGGIILNLMPCVLPVIGLKILGFAEQAGDSRKKILVLNLWYVAGMLAVFMALATLAAAAKLGIAEKGFGWGEQNSNTIFNIVMACVVFVMALSFLGIWEIPIPGFIGSGKTQKLAAKEGVSGAFIKGIVTTLLATPCSGPFLGPVFGFTLTQTATVIYLIFLFVGLGMASPYLLIGAFPTLIRWVPKPGAWMETFKHIMGFVLLGTVVFIFSYLQQEYIVPTLAFLIALWAACWWIGRTPTYEPLGKQLKAWAQGGVFAALIGWFAFSQLLPHKEVLAWQPFDRSQLTELNREGKTVLVDFTADWCLTCKYNLKTAINTQAVADAVAKNGVVTMLADWTDGDENITAMLNDLKSQSIPVLAIFPADRPGEVMVLRDVVTKSQVLEAISKAGPSREVPAQGIAQMDNR